MLGTVVVIMFMTVMIVTVAVVVVIMFMTVMIVTVAVVVVIGVFMAVSVMVFVVVIMVVAVMIVVILRSRDQRLKVVRGRNLCTGNIAAGRPRQAEHQISVGEYCRGFLQPGCLLFIPGRMLKTNDVGQGCINRHRQHLVLNHDAQVDDSMDVLRRHV